MGFVFSFLDTCSPREEGERVAGREVERAQGGALGIVSFFPSRENSQAACLAQSRLESVVSRFSRRALYVSRVRAGGARRRVPKRRPCGREEAQKEKRVEDCKKDVGLERKVL